MKSLQKREKILGSRKTQKALRRGDVCRRREGRNAISGVPLSFKGGKIYQKGNAHAYEASNPEDKKKRRLISKKINRSEEARKKGG